MPVSYDILDAKVPVSYDVLDAKVPVSYDVLDAKVPVVHGGKLELRGDQVPSEQGLTLVILSAQLERLLWDRGCA